MDTELRLNSLKNIETIDPYALLSSIGLNQTEVNKILHEKEYSILTHKIFNKPDVIDFDTIMKNHGKLLSTQLCRYFFQKARDNSSFTEQELTDYKETYQKFFDMCFEYGKSFIYKLAKIPAADNLLIKVDNLYYQLSIIDGCFIILYLKDFNIDNVSIESAGNN
jgi:hypothetical protein